MKHLRPYEEYITEEANPIGKAISKGIRKIFGKSKKSLN
jgi:hypothetical protein